MTGKQLVRPTGGPPPRGTSSAQGCGGSCSLPGSHTETHSRTKRGSQLPFEAWGEVQSHPGRPVSLRAPPGALSLPSFGKSNCRASLDRVWETASGLNLAFDGPFLPVVVGHLVEREQWAAAGQRVCEAEFAEGRLHAAVTDAVVSQLV